MDKIEVTQADRDAYAAALEKMKYARSADAVRNGFEDKHPIVQAFAAHRTNHADATPVAWMPIESAPHDEEILATIKVRHADGQTRWERHIILIDSETGMIRDVDFYHGWEAQEYTCWQPLPAAPDATNTHPPTTDVAALVEAAKAFQHYGCPVCSVDCGSANPPVIACPMKDLSAALAPFTKGQS